MTDYSQEFLKLLELQKVSPISDGSESFIINPLTGTMTTTYKGKPIEITTENPQYTATLKVLAEKNKDSLDLLTVKPPSEYVNPVVPAPGTTLTPVVEGSTTVLPETSLKETQAAVNKKAQQTDLMWKLGPAVAVGALQGAIDLWGKGTAKDIYVEKELKKAQKADAKGELGALTPDEIQKAMAGDRALKALVGEQALKDEAQEASGTGQTSAAQQQSIKEVKNKALVQSAQQSGRYISEFARAKIDNARKRMESMIEYKGNRQQEKRDRLVQSFANIAYVGSKAIAGTSTKVADNVDVLFDASELMDEPLSTKQLVQLNSVLTNRRSITEEDFDAKVRAAGIDPKLISAQDRALFYQAVT